MIKSACFAFTAFTCSLLAGIAYAENIFDAEKPAPLLQEQQEEKQTYLPDAALTMSVGGEAGLRYHDNLYRAPNNTQNDIVGTFAPGFRLKSDMKPYLLQVDTKLEAGHYFSHSDNDYNDADVKGRLGYDLNDISTLYADGRFNYGHVEVGGFVDDPQLLAEEPTTYRYGEAGAGWKLDSAGWVGLLDLRSLFYNYDNVDRLTGSRIVNDDRDFAQHSVTARGGYKFWPQTVWYVESSLNRRDYERQVDTSLGQPRDSGGYGLFTGITYGDARETPWFADLALGYAHQDYENAGLPDVGIPALRALLQWKPNETLRLRGDISRDIREVALLDVSAYVQTRARLRAEYEFAPQWTAGGGLRYTQNDFQVNPTVGLPGRVDNLWDESLSLDYALTPDYSLGGEVMRLSRRSDDSRVEFDSNVAMLRLRMNY